MKGPAYRPLPTDGKATVRRFLLSASDRQLTIVVLSSRGASSSCHVGPWQCMMCLHNMLCAVHIPAFEKKKTLISAYHAIITKTLNYIVLTTLSTGHTLTFSHSDKETQPFSGFCHSRRWARFWHFRLAVVWSLSQNLWGSLHYDEITVK